VVVLEVVVGRTVVCVVVGIGNVVVIGLIVVVGIVVVVRKIAVQYE
jgi:hypothetical protein